MLNIRRRAVVLLVALMLVSVSSQASAPAPPPAASLEGVWSTKWCDKARPGGECGGFTAFLVQDGDRICGRFAAARPCLTQVDEGNPRSIRGVVVEGAAIVAATSARNEGTYLVRLDRKGSDLCWHLLEQVGVLDNGDIQLLALDELLAREDAALDREQLAAVKGECLSN